ncbi:MAG: DUF1146 domain-containing protein, partial [Bacilli bacterium]|nr:DUF1146 domain-containing protein [Bacilli bacterium]
LLIYFLLIPIVYKVVIAIDFTKIFKKYHVNEIRLFYIIVVIVITKILGDTVVMIINYFREVALTM